LQDRRPSGNERLVAAKCYQICHCGLIFISQPLSHYVSQGVRASLHLCS
jgi:hypothetical protein